MEDARTKGDKPDEDIVIKDCGELAADADIGTGKKEKDESGDAYESHPSGGSSFHCD